VFLIVQLLVNLFVQTMVARCSSRYEDIVIVTITISMDGLDTQCHKQTHKETQKHRERTTNQQTLLNSVC